MAIEVSGLLLGLLGLWLGTEWTINSAISIAKHYKLSDLFVGMGILAIGSDLPELAVAIDAGITTYQGINASAMVVGSSIGSAFAQIGLVLGITGLSGYLLIGRSYLLRHGVVLVGSIVVLWLVGYDGLVSRLDGLILLVLFIIYFLLLLKEETTDSKSLIGDRGPVPQTWFKLVGGIATIIAASELTVSTAIQLAERLEIAQVVIAMFVVGVGTSLPELSISLGAIRQKRGALSVGNILGSNIFDTLVPIGAASIIYPVQFDGRLLYFDLPILAALSILVLLLFLYKKGLQKREAVVVLVAYGCYAAANLIFL